MLKLSLLAGLVAAASRPPPGKYTYDYRPFHHTEQEITADGKVHNRLVHPEPYKRSKMNPPIGKDLKPLLGTTDDSGWPEYRGAIIPGAPPIHIEGACFKDTVMSGNIDASGKLQLSIHVQNATSAVCADLYLLCTGANWNIQHFFFSGDQSTSWYDFVNDADKRDVMNHGIRVILFTGDVTDELGLLWDLYKIVKNEDRSEIVEFLEDKTDIKFDRRDNVKVVPDPKDIKAGDVFGAWHPSAAQTIISWVSGRAVGHGAIVLEIEGELWLCETQPPDEKLNSPKDGIQRMKFADWLESRHKGGLTVWWMRLNDERRAKFNNTAAVQWFLKHEGEPYGYQVLAPTALDTLDQNLPPPFVKEEVWVLAAIVQHLSAEYIQMTLLQPFNIRIGANCTTVECAMDLSHAKGYPSPMAVLMMPEKDEWEYSFKDGVTRRAYVCDTMVVELLKVGGAITEQIVSNEFTPRDMQELGIFNMTVLPYCKEGGPGWCVITGETISNNIGVGSVVPYDHMFERCGTPPPSFNKVPANC